MRIKFYLLTLLLMTLLTTGWIFNTGLSQPEVRPSTAQENISQIDDVTLDTFIRIYATSILNCDNYEISADNRETIRNLLLSMGEVNIELLKSAIFDGSSENNYETIKTFSENNFMWEEKTILKQYLTN